jgi:hypothetical protein
MTTQLRRLAALCLVILTVLVVTNARVTTTGALPLIQQSGLKYVGAFRVPAGNFGGSSFAYGGTAMAYNPARNSLFMVGHDWQQQVAEVSIPTPVNSTSVDALPTATVIQPFADATEGRFGMVSSDIPGVKVGGLMVLDTKLYGSLYIYYDGSGSQKLSHFVHSTNLSQSSVQGPFEVANTGAVAGHMLPVPQTWQSLLGGPFLTGQCCIPILSRTSFGMSAFAFNPSQLGQVSPVPTTKLLFYPQDHQLSTWDQTSSMFNGSTHLAGMVFPEGSGSLLYFGRQGIGTYCYGYGTTIQPVPPPDAGGTGYCYDPTSDSKGNHAYPLVYQVWAYSADDLAAVKRGAKQSWELRPYATWQLTFPITTWLAQLNGIAYDPSRQRIWVSQAFGDGDRPVIHAFDLNLAPVPSIASPQNVRIVG